MIFGRHSVLKRGCSTWDPAKAPQEEFETRLEAVRGEMARLELEALVIYGDNFSFADLCYLTHYFPKVRGGIAVVPLRGAVSLLLNIGSRDVPFAKTLTWVEDVRASNQVGLDGANLLAEKGFGKGRVGLADSGRGFPLPQLEDLKAALPQVEWTACDALIAPMREKKSPRELAAMGEAGRILGEILTEARGFMAPRRKEYEVVADIDRLARDKGAEDIRILAGENRLLPPSFKQARPMGSQWALYLAVQHERYWVEAGRTYLLENDQRMLEAYRRAEEVVGRMAAQLRPGNSVAAIDAAARQELAESYATAMLYGVGNGIGLNLWEAPFVNESDAREAGAPSAGTPVLSENMTLAVRAVFETEGKLMIYGDSLRVTHAGPRRLLEL